MFRSQRCRFLLVIFLLAPIAAEAGVLCASPLGHLRMRERCQRHETRVDVRGLLGDERDAVPLADWEVRTAAPVIEGLASVASAPDATMLGVSPCRLIDTRPGFSSALAGDDIGAFSDFEIRTYTVAGFCGVPTGATALSINLAVVPGSSDGFASVGPTGSIPAFPPGPSFASINFVGSGPAISNSLIVPVDDMGRIDVYAARSADVIIDTNGYFQPKDAGTNVFFVPGAGTDLENGAVLAATVAEVNALPAGTRASIELGPGVFDLDTTGISLSRRTAMVGAGQEATTITCDAPTAVDISAAADGTSLRGLTVINTSASISSNVVRTAADDFASRDVTLSSTGGRGLLLFPAPTGALVERTTIEAASNVIQLSSTGGDVVVRDSILHGAKNVMVVIGPGMATIENSTLESDGGSFATIAGNADGIIVVRHSRLLAAGTYASGTGGSFTMNHSFVDAATITSTATLSCSATSEPSGFTTTGCP